jgi:hypothetical protein
MIQHAGSVHESTKQSGDESSTECKRMQLYAINKMHLSDGIEVANEFVKHTDKQFKWGKKCATYRVVIRSRVCSIRSVGGNGWIVWKGSWCKWT